MADYVQLDIRPSRFSKKDTPRDPRARVASEPCAKYMNEQRLVCCRWSQLEDVSNRLTEARSVPTTMYPRECMCPFVRDRARSLLVVREATGLSVAERERDVRNNALEKRRALSLECNDF